MKTWAQQQAAYDANPLGELHPAAEDWRRTAAAPYGEGHSSYDSDFYYIVETQDGLAYEFPFDEVEEVDIRESGALVVTCYDVAASQAFAVNAWTRLYILEDSPPDTEPSREAA